MTDERDSPELEPLPPELEAVVQRMREDVPSPAQLADLGARVVAAMTTPPTPPAPVPEVASSGAAAGLTATSVVAGLALSVLASLAVVGIASYASGPAPLGSGDAAARGGDDVGRDGGAGTDARETRAEEPSPTGLEAEHVLLERARRIARSDPAGALALAEEHARLAPDGVLAQEREVIAVEALRALGRSAEARSRHAAFLARWPGSPYTGRLGPRAR